MSEDQLIHNVRGKSKNSLALNKKVAAIRRYEVDPVYSSVARHFHCSPDQIKRIIKQKDEILKEWDNLANNLAKQKIDAQKPKPATVSCEKLSVKMVILCKAVYGRIHRQMSDSNFQLTDAHIEAVATEFKNVFNLTNFFPDKAWIKSFREAYNLKEEEPKTVNEGNASGSWESEVEHNEASEVEKTFSPENKVRFDNRVKPKNVLALNEKVAAIRRYEVDPVYKSVGRYFNCSPDQIKRIIKQKDEILNEWENRTKKRQINLTREMKTVKISFLGKAVHEWIRRMMYYSDFDLTDALIGTMAIEFKKALNLPNFFPDKSWITSFRNTYNLEDVSTKTLNIGHKEGHSVQIRDILRFLQSICGSSETEIPQNDSPDVSASAVSSKISTSKPAASVVGKRMKVLKKANKPSGKKKKPKRNAKSSAKALKQKHINYICLPSTVVSNTAMPVLSTEEVSLVIKSEPDEVAPMEAESERTIISYEEAINYIRQLEEFALLKENFRLIGLIERLEEALKEQK